MADRYHNRPLPSDEYGHASDQQGGVESDPLAELARLIGQTDPFGTQSRPNARPVAPERYQRPVEAYPQESDDQGYDDQAHEEPAPSSPPSWMRRANVTPQPAPEEDYQPVVSPVHPLHRYPASQPEPEPHYQQPQAYQEPEVEADPSRYDDALYGRLQTGEQDFQRDPAYPDDPYAYQNEYAEDGLEDEPPRKRGGMMTVAAIIALAVVGTGGAFAYKTYLGSPRSGEPPIIKADNSPTKIVPAPTDGSAKVPDRMASADGTEKIVPREEAPVDINAKSGGPRVVFPPLNPNANPPPVSSVTSSALSPSAGPVPSNGTMPNSEPRKIRTLSVRGDQTDSTTPQGASAAAAARPPAAAPRAAAPTSHNPPTSANASANQPLSLSPQGGPQPAAGQQVASTSPTQIMPNSGGGGGYLVQVSSQRSESDAQASYRALQGKYPSVLGSQASVVKRVDLGEKGVYYRAFAGPFSSHDQAVQVCSSLKAAGGPQCLVQRN